MGPPTVREASANLRSVKPILFSYQRHFLWPPHQPKLDCDLKPARNQNLLSDRKPKRATSHQALSMPSQPFLFRPTRSEFLRHFEAGFKNHFFLEDQLPRERRRLFYERENQQTISTTFGADGSATLPSQNRPEH